MVLLPFEILAIGFRLQFKQQSTGLIKYELLKFITPRDMLIGILMKLGIASLNCNYVLEWKVRTIKVKQIF
jgi:hypothetical protein